MSTFLFHDAAHTSAVTVVSLCHVLQRLQPRLLLVKSCRRFFQLFPGLSQLLIPFLILFLDSNDLLLQIGILILYRFQLLLPVEKIFLKIRFLALAL